MDFIGEDGIKRILHARVLKEIPLVCETPVDDHGTTGAASQR